MHYLAEDINDHLEWVVTTAFYQAVHYIEAVFSIDQIHSTKHRERFTRLKQHHPDLYTWLSKLEAHSRKARYLEGVKGCYAQHMPPKRAMDDIVEGWLVHLKSRASEIIDERVRQNKTSRSASP